MRSPSSSARCCSRRGGGGGGGGGGGAPAGAGAMQAVEAVPHRREAGAGRAAWWAAAIQFAGTIFFNITTFPALQTELSDPSYDRLVWRPDAFGSTCFLVSGLIAYFAGRRGRLPLRPGRGWWQPVINLLGCILFGVAAVAGYVVPSSGSMLDLAAANWTTSAGAACFLVCALAALGGGQDHHGERSSDARAGE